MLNSSIVIFYIDPLWKIKVTFQKISLLYTPNAVMSNAYNLSLDITFLYVCIYEENVYVLGANPTPFFISSNVPVSNINSRRINCNLS